MLYVVATPIGNLDDISLRALKVLTEADIIACEDTRNTQKLLNHYEIKGKKLVSYHEHNEENSSDKIIEILENEQTVALVSDAGLPCISDPGYILIKKCTEKNIKVTTIPGANAGLTALVSSGIESYKYTFHGFLPRKNKELTEKLSTILEEDSTSIIYESPHRITNLVEKIVELDSKRVISVSRELTKMFEQIETKPAEQILEMLNEGTIKNKGEFVVVIAPNHKKEESIFDNEKLIKEVEKLVNEGMKNSEAIKTVAKKYGINKREVYNLYHEKIS